MQFKRITFSLIVISALLLSACTGTPGEGGIVVQDEPTSGEVMMEDGGQDSMAEEMSGDDGMSAEDEGDTVMGAESGAMEDKGSMAGSAHDGEMMDAPEWFSTELINARSGESFRITDFKGKVVLLETMAVWCSSCLRQQKQVKALHDILGKRDDFVSLGLDIDPNEESEQLKNFTDQNGFEWVYAISPAEVSRELGQLYGAQYLNPPSTPMLIIDRHGEVHTLPFGVKSAEELAEALQPFLDESM